MIGVRLAGHRGHADGARRSIPRPTARAIRARLGVVPQQDTLDQELTVRENLAHLRALLRSAAAASSGERVAELLDFVQLTERANDPGRAALGRDEAPPHDRSQPDQRAGPAAPRRADHRARPAGAPPAVGPPVPAEAARRDARPDDPLHGRGRAALRPPRRHGPRPDRRRGLAAPADRALLAPARCSSCGSRSASRRRSTAGSTASASGSSALPDRVLVYADDGDAAAAPRPTSAAFDRR